MPHFIIDCSEHIIQQKSPDEIMQAVYDVAEATGLFALNDIKVRLRPYHYFKLGAGKQDFIHIFGNIMEGRSTEQKADLSKQIIEKLNEMFPDISILSINIREFEKATYSNKALIHPLNTANDRHFDTQKESVMKNVSKELGAPAATANAPSLPATADRATWQAELDALLVREKAHTREGDAIAAARRRLPMVEVDPTTPLIGPHGPVTLLEAFEGRRQLIAYYFMWNTGKPAAEQCEGCTWVTTQVTELSYLHSRDITYAVFCQGPYDESSRYRDFMGWEVPWYSAESSLDVLLVGREIGRMHLVCYLRDGDRVFETYWTTVRGVEAMDYSYALMDLTVYGRQELWEDSPPGWIRDPGSPSDDVRLRSNGRPIPQWSRLEAGRSDDLGTAGR